MNLQHTIDPIKLLAVLCLISLITITYLTSSVKGSDVKSDAWSNTYNQHLYSDLTGTIRELTAADSNDDTDTRFQPPLETNNQKVQPIAEGYRLASTDMISPAISVSVNKETSHERHKRDASSDNSSIPAIALKSAISINPESASSILSNNGSDDDPIISDADANSWALSLSLATGFDGSGNEETTTEVETTETTTIQLFSTEESTIYSVTTTLASTESETDVTAISISTTEETSFVSTISYETEEGLTSTEFTLVSSASTTITSMEGTQTEEVSVTATETPSVLSTTEQTFTEATETEIVSVSETEILSTSTASSLETEIVTGSEASTIEILSTESGSSVVVPTTTEQSTEEVTNNMSETEAYSTIVISQSSTEASPVTGTVTNEEESTMETSSSEASVLPTTEIDNQQSTAPTEEVTVTASETEIPSTTAATLSTITSPSSLETEIVTSIETETIEVSSIGTSSASTTEAVSAVSEPEESTIQTSFATISPTETVSEGPETTAETFSESSSQTTIPFSTEALTTTSLETITETEISVTSTAAVESTSETLTSSTTSEELGTVSGSESTLTTISSTISELNTVSELSTETASFATESMAPSIQTETESVLSTITTATSETIIVSETEFSPSQSTLSTLTTIPTISSISPLSTEEVSEIVATDETTLSSSPTLNSESSTQTLTTSEGTEIVTITESEISSSSSPVSLSSETSFMLETETSSTTASPTTTSFLGPPLFYLYFAFAPNGRPSSRALAISAPAASTLENGIANIFYGLNISCNDTCLYLSSTNGAVLPDEEVLVSVALNSQQISVPQRIMLVTDLFNNNITINDTYYLDVVRISMNLTTLDFLSFTGPIPMCKICDFTGVGYCTSNDSDSNCTCFPNYEGQYCEYFVQSTTNHFSTATLSTYTISSTLTSEISTGSAVTLTQSASIASESPTVYYSTSATATSALFSSTIGGTIESTSTTILSTAEITSPSVSATIGTTAQTETIKITSAPTVITGSVSSTVITTSNIIELTVTSSISTSQVTTETAVHTTVGTATVETTIAATLSTRTTSSTGIATAVVSETITSTAPMTSYITGVTETGKASSAITAIETPLSSSITTPTLTGQTIFSTTTIGTTEGTVTGGITLPPAGTATSRSSSITTPTLSEQTVFSTTTIGTTEGTVTGGITLPPAGTATSRSSSITTPTLSEQTVFSTTTIGTTEGTVTGGITSPVTFTPTSRSSSITTPTLSEQTVFSTTTIGTTEGTVTGGITSPVTFTPTSRSSSITVPTLSEQTVFSTTTIGSTEGTVTGATSTPITITEIISSNTAATSTTTAQTISLSTTSALIQETVTSTITTETGISSGTTTLAVTVSTISSVRTNGITTETVTSESSTLTATTEITVVSSITTVVAQTASPITTSITAEQTSASEAFSTRTSTETGSSNSRTTSTSGVTEQTTPSEIITSTATTETATLSATITSSATASSTIQETVTGEVSSSTVHTETGSSSNPITSTITASAILSTGTSSIIEETVTSQTSILTTATQTTHSGSITTSTVAAETIFSTTASGTTEGTVTSTGSSTISNTGTSSSSSTTMSTVVSETIIHTTTMASSITGQITTSETATVSAGTTSPTTLTAAGTTTHAVTTESTTSTTTSSVTTSTSSTTMTTSTTQSTTTTVSPTTIETTTSTPITSNCAWTNWVPIGNCTPSCGTAYQQVTRSCIDSATDLDCSSADCGGGSATQNQSCPGSPPCETLPVTPMPSTRDPRVQTATYLLPDQMYFFEQNYRRIWITNKGYISFDTPLYSQTMTSSVFGLLSGQAVAAPFWADLTYASSSNISLNWFSSVSGSQADMNAYYPVIQRTINDACPVQSCASNFAAVRLLRINWTNLQYQPRNVNQSTSISFSMYLINTYETLSYSYPILRSYLSFDYSALPSSLGNLRPFVGYRGKYTFVVSRNDPTYYQNVGFLRQSTYLSSYVGGRFLSQCEVSFMQETSINTQNPSGNLNDAVNNPRIPCPCTFAQAQIDRRFSRLQSENGYETSQGVQCFGPLVTSWIRWGWGFKPLKSQTCCYDINYGNLITYGPLAGSVLSDPIILFQQYGWQRRIQFHDACCSPTYTTSQPDWNSCTLYYQLHPASTCTGYQPPTIVTGVGDPHIATIDNGRYTCHIQGLYVFAQTSINASLQAENNSNTAGLSDSNSLYPDDLFYIYVQSVLIPPALPYIERMQGDASIFSSYTIGASNYTFVISNNFGRFGFTASNQTSNISLTNSLANNLNYDFVSTMDTSQRYIYRLKQTNQVLTNISVPQLVFSLWSGLSIQCQIVGENLECALLLPLKYRTYVEGLAGNYNGNYTDDLVNRQTNTIVPISPSSNSMPVGNDTNILNACRSWKVSNDTTLDIVNPIMPVGLVNWYYSTSDMLTGLNLKLSQTVVNGTCSSSFECLHDYIIRLNPITSAATAASVNQFQQSRTLLAQIIPTTNITSVIQIELPFNNPSRAYSIPVSITGANTSSVTINENGTRLTNPIFGSLINIPTIPTDNSSFVEVSLNLNYGVNSTAIIFLNIIACLCTNSSNCNYNQLTTLSTHYQLASCDCSAESEGIFCQDPYDGCEPCSCKINWNTGTTCIQLNATEQSRENKSYICNGFCDEGYNSTDGYTCDDIDECDNLTICGNGICQNQVGSYSCDCPDGYKFANQTCVDIDECTERYVNGNYTAHCDIGKYCTNTIGNFTCTCEPIFNTTGTCVFNPSLCNNDTCRLPGSSSVTCIHGTMNINNICIPWCQSTCPGLCQLTNGFYQCNCLAFPGFEPSDYGRSCSQCGSLNYGYGCSESCECNFGTCNPNATEVNSSCSCTSYLAPTCLRRVDVCASSGNPCDNATEECLTDPSTGAANCTCQLGFERISVNASCLDINECAIQQDHCDTDVSNCSNTIGSYICICLPGYEADNGSCIDINECAANEAICSTYMNTYCTNTPGSYECRCSANYSLGGDYTQTYGNARNTNITCQLTDYSSFCQNQCLPPAVCSSATGRCECPSSDYTLAVYAPNATLQTCLCPGHPFVYFDGRSCISATGRAWLLLNFYPQISRTVVLNNSNSNNLQDTVNNIVSDIDVTCDNPCINVFDTEEIAAPDIQLMVTVNADMDTVQRLELSNEIFNESLTYDGQHYLAWLQIEMNGRLINFTGVRPLCEACVYGITGICNADLTGCICLQNRTGRYCQQFLPTDSGALQSQAPETNWTIIVAVVSSIAGLFLLVSLAMCAYYLITKCRRSTTIIKPPINRPQFTIPRAHIPTMGTGSRVLTSWDGFSLDNTHDEQFVDASDSFPSSSNTSYNTTYRANGGRPEADFGIFDELENRTAMSRGHIPRPQMTDMLGTLNSFPAQDLFDDPSGGGSSFSDSRDIDEIELVTDMLDDMTKDDNNEDEFVEALNPNLAIPRLALEPELKSSGWLSFFRNS